ncbi:hypothetical protein AK812_SmicGene42528 [Symbiodinium microadriaticum]|uniref:Uncharacterized protein n=1 Tax=Symbiodinium microadriaticum TaxID=2951 RepID=A0A1Q9C3B2_SYMMI|nr:hypothetical protein AK812_SmicGene42528 [Symbiodinium microadriaticum]
MMISSLTEAGPELNQRPECQPPFTVLAPLVDSGPQSPSYQKARQARHEVRNRSAITSLRSFNYMIDGKTCSELIFSKSPSRFRAFSQLQAEAETHYAGGRLAPHAKLLYTAKEVPLFHHLGDPAARRLARELLDP